MNLILYLTSLKPVQLICQYTSMELENGDSSSIGYQENITHEVQICKKKEKEYKCKQTLMSVDKANQTQNHRSLLLYHRD